MKKTFWIAASIAVCLCQQLFSQNKFHSVLDDFYGNILFPNVSYELVNTKIELPGLSHPKGNSMNAGISPNVRDWRGLYAWSEWKNGPGRLGAYAGSLNFDVRKPDYEHSFDGAFWITPFRNNTFKGISFTLGSNLYHSESENETRFWEEDFSRFDFTTTSLVKLNSTYHLRAGVKGELYDEKHSSISRDETTGFSDKYEKNISKSSGTAVIGLVDKEGRRLDLNAEGAVHHNDSSYGEVDFNLVFSDGRKFRYGDHTLYYGVASSFEAHLLSEIDENTPGYAYMTLLGNIRDEKTFYGYISLPVIVNIRLHKSIHALLALNPSLNGEYRFHAGTEENSYRFRLSLSRLQLGLTGVLGERIEWYLRPDIDSDVFVSALEVKCIF
ncbi:MAG: hypothetical protein ACLFQB_10410 [Chitinispirillaceae bacterium]